MRERMRGANTKPATCRDCGQSLAAGQGLTYESWGYPWDGSDTEGSIMVVLDSYTICQCRTDCARRVVEQGTNLQALRAVARDGENLGNLATEARAILQTWAELAQAQAVTDDLVARESGWGVIGGPARRM